MASIKITITGSGTSQGIPVIACQCDTCNSADPRDTRLRCSLLVESEQATIVIDAGPDFRQQMLTNKVKRLDALFLTHEHNDHIIGLDDVRPYIFIVNKPLVIYSMSRVLSDVRARFGYAFSEKPYPGSPRFELKAIDSGDVIVIGDIKIEVIRLQHGRLPILGFIVNDKLAYCTDTNYLSDNIVERLQDINVLILDALRHEPHHSHFSLREAITIARKINAQRTYLTHISHNLGPTSRWEMELSKNILPSFDGLSLVI